VELNVKLRNGFLASLLAALITLAGLSSFVARAQTSDDATATDITKGYSAQRPENGHAYIITMVDGRFVCRDATPAERIQILKRNPNVRTSPVSPSLDGEGFQADAIQTDSTGYKTSTANLTAGHLDIILRPTAQLQANAAALAAFQRAAATWENLITTEITVVIDVDFGPTRFGETYPDGVLGSTSGGIFYAPPYSDVRNRLNVHASNANESNLYASLPTGTGVPTDSGTLTKMDVASPLARALQAISANADPNDTTGDDSLGNAPSIGFNSGADFPFDFDPSDGISPNTIDFDAVATHEIGHVLGFDSEAGLLEVAPTATLRPTIWDLFRFRPGTTTATFSTAQRVMTTGGEQRYFDGSPELGLSTGNPDGKNGDGEQSSHWKDDHFTHFYIGIMDPTLSPGARQQMTNNDRRAIDFLGYNLGALPAAPANDNFVNAITLQGSAGSVNGTNANATKEAGEPAPIPNLTPGGRSIWYNWTAPGTGNATFDTNGSDFDTVLAVYTGSAVNALSASIASSDDISAQNHASRVQFAVTAGTVYRITVDGFDGTSGSITLNWTSTVATPTPTPTPTPVPTPTPATVTGRVVEGTQGLQGVFVGLSSANGTLLQQTTTGVDGRWSFTGASVVVGQAYNISFVKSGYSFAPPGLAFSVNQAAQDMGDVVATKGNQIDASDFFVTQHYRDFLGREPDPSGLNFWTNEIEGCGLNLQCRQVKRINVSAAFFLSIEFQETGYLVERMYKVAYGDLTEASTGLVVPIIKRQEFLADTPLISSGVVVGVGNWQAQLDNNKNAYALAFVQRSRFTSAYPAGMTPSQFVARLDQNTGGALTQTQQVDALVGELTANNTDAGRASVLRKVAENAEVDRREKNRAFVLMEYYGYLRRNPNDAPNTPLDFSGYNFWLTKLNQFSGNFVQAEMVKAFLDSTEYRQRFGQ
jgi:hypothetical protein